jgi:hypothetical protein
MAPELLEQRLAGLTIEVPDAGRVTARALSRAAMRRRHHFTRSAVVAMVTLAAMLGVLYFAPRADAVLADTPIAGGLLRDAGLVGAGDRVTAVGSVSTSSGYRLELVGAYADSTRTVLLLHAQPAIYLGGPGPELKDQFGRSYQWRSAVANGRTGDVVMEFESLAWPDAITGARITLHWTVVQSAGCVASSVDASGYPVCNPGPPVAGSWTLPAIIGVDEGTVLALPAPANLGPANFRFTSVVSTPATIGVEIEETGMSFEDLMKIVPDGFKGRPAFTIDLLGPGGVTDMGSGDSSSSDDLTGTHIHIKLRWPRDSSAAGDYRLRIAYEGLGAFDRVLHVP